MVFAFQQNNLEKAVKTVVDELRPLANEKLLQIIIEQNSEDFTAINDWGGSDFSFVIPKLSTVKQ